ncbi:hypothetical protein TPHA_0I00920 [Tetrapisispora phaffii CBS 4417]|uniref:Protein kinase domain-containing protein n=1 Tax=Tetrapisispora phaffii (strain ATCC 24235 / CBS 4417 / NBRC 1672 / NRRL Y-8282 / UCD 70-5) TaxID=1071381 RepID=G8BXH0_TETPH|nr:hypothetical protein TPHA_0I00920 [Tetrapisispora phaffii CBS 4417]CCE64598.1 hypothetical protein TPHA_0I00920 [Tetrapisispora phaffii CBS 4417]
MQFTKRLSNVSHSRSSSASSLAHNASGSPTSNSSKQSLNLNKHSSKKTKEKIVLSITEQPILSHSQSSSMSSSNGNINTYLSNGGTIYEELDNEVNNTLRKSINSNVLKPTTSGQYLHISPMERENSNSSNNIILPWDTTDPNKWTTERIVLWLKFYEFPDLWIRFFEKHQINGNNFIRLLAKENFALYEKYLPESKAGSYNRFQHLLKETMSKNVTYNYGRNKNSDKMKPTRSSSEANNIPTKLADPTTTRSTSDSIVNTTKVPTGSSKFKEANVSINKHKKTKSTSSIYRRSFISLRSAANFSQPPTKSHNDINLKIPIQDVTNQNPKLLSSKSATTPPMSPNIFRRHQKSNSSDSSLFNFLFGTTAGTTPNTSTAKLQPHFKGTNEPTVSNKSTKSVIASSDSNNATLTSQKFDKNSQSKSQEYNSIIHPTKSADATLTRPSKITLPQTNLSFENVTDTTADRIEINFNVEKKDEDKTENVKESKSSDFKDSSKNNGILLIDDKYKPVPIESNIGSPYILITKDNSFFYPIPWNPEKSLEKFKEHILHVLSLKGKPVTIHLTDYENDPGHSLPDTLVTKLLAELPKNDTLKFLIKDRSKPHLRSRAATVSSEPNVSLRSVKSRGSVRSINSTNINSIDQFTITSSDTNSYDDRVSSSAKRYPQTPSHYYDYTNSEETNYWNVKDNHDDASSLKLKSKQSLSNLHAEKSISYFSTPDSRTSDFVSKEDLTETDSRKLSQSELAPKRDAPKAPGSISPQQRLSLSKKSSLKLKRAATKLTYSGSVNSPPKLQHGSPEYKAQPIEATVSSYTPASTHVLVPQPYKGASDFSRKSKADDEIPTASILKQITANRKNSMSSVLTKRPSIGSRANSKRIISSSSAADVFEENIINFSDAPNLSESDTDDSLDEIIWTKKKDHDDNNDGRSNDTDDNSDSSDDIIWSNANSSKNSINKYHDATNILEDEGDIHASRIKDGNNHLEQNSLQKGNDGLSRKMTLRPSPEEVYKNLEKFFPEANLDKPVLEGPTPPSSPNIGNQSFPNRGHTANTDLSSTAGSSDTKADVMNKSFFSSKPLKRTKTIRTIAHEASKARKNSRKITRQNTKMWGTKIFEVTDTQGLPINKSKNSRGEYNEFAWMKGEMIGKGSFGAVFLSLNITTGEMMAVKQIEVPSYGSQSETMLNTVEAMKSEVSTLKDLDHLNIVQYLGFEMKHNIYSLFLEYVAGGSVGSLIRMYGRFDDKLIRHLTNQVLEGLSYLHSQGILHRDMKADNLLLDQDGICKISDFGISKKSEDIYSNSEMTMRGTVFWMAPEMVDTKQGYNAKVDIWSLGCVVLEMFAGKRPWSNFEVVTAMYKIGQSKSAPPIPEDTKDLISPTAKNFLNQCFHIDPKERPTAGQLLEHPFCYNDDSFIFNKTKLAEFIKSNDKINSTKLRITSQE